MTNNRRGKLMRFKSILKQNEASPLCLDVSFNAYANRNLINISRTWLVPCRGFIFKVWSGYDLNKIATTCIEHLIESFDNKLRRITWLSWTFVKLFCWFYGLKFHFCKRELWNETTFLHTIKHQLNCKWKKCASKSLERASTWTQKMHSNQNEVKHKKRNRKWLHSKKKQKKKKNLIRTAEFLFSSLALIWWDEFAVNPLSNCTTIGSKAFHELKAFHSSSSYIWQRHAVQP